MALGVLHFYGEVKDQTNWPNIHWPPGGHNQQRDEDRRVAGDNEKLKKAEVVLVNSRPSSIYSI